MSEEADDVRIALYLSGPTWDALGAAYMWQVDHGANVNPKNLWVVQCIENHAARTVTERMRLSRDLPDQESDSRGRLTRSIVVGTDIRELIRDASANERPHRWLSPGAWGLEAVRVEIEDLRRQAGGAFPHSPPRTPARVHPRRGPATS